MNPQPNQNTIAGLIEYRGQIVAAHIPVALLIMDATSYANTRVEHNRVEALDTDYTTHERAEHRKRADALEAWIRGGCSGTIPFAVDVTLSLRTAFAPMVVMPENLDTYLDAVLAVSDVVPAASVDAPQFLIRSDDNGTELWLTDNRKLRAPRLHSGPEVTVVETAVADLKAVIAVQRGSLSASAAMLA